MPVFFCQDFDLQYIEGEEFNHIQAFRLSDGQCATLTDGKGNFAEIRLTKKEKNKFFYTLIQTYQQEPSPFQVHLYVAPTKNHDRMEWLCEKIVELGIQRITFITSRYCERKKIDLERIKRICIAALKQSRQAYLPLINQSDIDQSLMASLSQDKKLILDQSGSPFLSCIDSSAKSYQLMIGPEGGWSEQELSMFEKNHFQVAKLTNSVLRTETAALMACLAIKLFEP